jgi:hypothetical protein
METSWGGRITALELPKSCWSEESDRQVEDSRRGSWVRAAENGLTSGSQPEGHAMPE